MLTLQRRHSDVTDLPRDHPGYDRSTSAPFSNTIRPRTFIGNGMKNFPFTEVDVHILQTGTPRSPLPKLLIDNNHLLWRAACWEALFATAEAHGFTLSEGFSLTPK